VLVENIYRISLTQVIYLIATGQLTHFIEKKRLVSGDLVLIKYRGKYRKAFITCTAIHYNDMRVQLKFLDKELNIDLVANNWYPLSRIIIPEFLGGKASRVLYSDLED
jgi:hypothetical protein